MIVCACRGRFALPDVRRLRLRPPGKDFLAAALSGNLRFHTGLSNPKSGRRQDEKAAGRRAFDVAPCGARHILPPRKSRAGANAPARRTGAPHYPRRVIPAQAGIQQARIIFVFFLPAAFRLWPDALNNAVDARKSFILGCNFVSYGQSRRRLRGLKQPRSGVNLFLIGPRIVNRVRLSRMFRIVPALVRTRWTRIRRLYGKRFSASPERGFG